MAEEERDADVAGEERVPAAAERGALTFHLADRVHGEGAGSVEPDCVARAAVENEEGVRVAGRAMAEDGPFRERPRAPGQLAAGPRELEVEEVAERRHHAWRAVTPLHADLVGTRTLPRDPVREPALAENVRLEVRRLERFSPAGECPHVRGVAVRPADRKSTRPNSSHPVI